MALSGFFLPHRLLGLDLHGHFDHLGEEAQSFHPHDLLNASLRGTNLYHQENTVTNDLSMEEGENYEYVDFDKFLREDDYSDIIDSIPEVTSYVDQGNVLALFRGKTRIQRLNILNAYFGFNLYRSLRDQVNSSDNIFLAPVGISTAMAMISLGLRGQTQEEVLDVLGFEDFVNASATYDYTTVHNLFHKLTHRLFRRNFGYTLRSVNDLYVQRQFSLLNEFKDNMKKYYFAEAQVADFSDPTFVSRANERIVKLTKGLIKDALVNIHPDTLSFRLNEKETVKVPMMKVKANFLATEDNELDCRVLQLPYVGNISMLIVLPYKLSGLKTLENQLSPQVVERWQKDMTNRTREVLVPRFKLEKSYDLIENLKAMGIVELFTPRGNYSGISEEKITINKFNHQGTITVNEEGTEAASVTTVGFMPLSAQIRFIIDHPFLFLIYEHRTNCLLFMGRVSNPSKC
ncbi:hypothetical protein E2320_012636 [Naja naja]|nr:hypothetical protein E2320_012636 [Naja naja]